MPERARSLVCRRWPRTGRRRAGCRSRRPCTWRMPTRSSPRPSGRVPVLTCRGVGVDDVDDCPEPSRSARRHRQGRQSLLRPLAPGRRAPRPSDSARVEYLLSTSAAPRPTAGLYFLPMFLSERPSAWARETHSGYSTAVMDWHIPASGFVDLLGGCHSDIRLRLHHADCLQGAALSSWFELDGWFRCLRCAVYAQPKCFMTASMPLCSWFCSALVSGAWSQYASTNAFRTSWLVGPQLWKRVPSSTVALARSDTLER